MQYKLRKIQYKRRKKNQYKLKIAQVRLAFRYSKWAFYFLKISCTKSYRAFLQTLGACPPIYFLLKCLILFSESLLSI